MSWVLALVAPYMVDRSSWSCCNDVEIEKKKSHIKFFYSKAKVLVEEVERKLELLCKGSRGNISKL